jgi:hypothetical protein
MLLCLLFLQACDVYQLTTTKEDRDRDRRNAAVLLLSQAPVVDSVRATCDGPAGKPRNERNLVSVTAGNFVYHAGYSQITSTNQDAYVYRTMGGILDWCYYYDTSPADTRGEALLVHQNSIFVAFTTDGGNATFKASEDAIQKSYGTGGGPKVSFLARLDELGSFQRGTFLAARLNDGKVNTLTPRSLTSSSSGILFEGNTAFDGGVANDSLDKGNSCASGNIRRIEMNTDLNKILAINCIPN